MAHRAFARRDTKEHVYRTARCRQWSRRLRERSTTCRHTLPKDVPTGQTFRGGSAAALMSAVLALDRCYYW
jgi:hypothetical protein